MKTIASFVYPHMQKSHTDGYHNYSHVIKSNFIYNLS